MKDFPHIYTSTAKGTDDVKLKLDVEKLPSLEVTPPEEFGGPAGFWNPEAFFSASVSTCFILTFKSITRAMKLPWQEITVDADAYLDKTGGKLSFTKVDIFVTLKIDDPSLEEKFMGALKKAEENCLITNSIKSETCLQARIINS